MTNQDKYRKNRLTGIYDLNNTTSKLIRDSKHNSEKHLMRPQSYYVKLTRIAGYHYLIMI